jgi:hypothetical protein
MDLKGTTGTATTIGATIASYLPVVNELVQIGAGIVAIVVGILTARYYIKKTNLLK